MKKKIWIPLAVAAAAVCAVVIFALAQAGAFCGHVWQEATCDRGELCALCGKAQGEALGHDYREADCELPETCGRCGVTRGDALGHNWQAADCLQPETCKTCGQKRGKALGHDWKTVDCLTPVTCGRCGGTEGEPVGHSWREATCTTPKTCAACGTAEGEPAGHNWKDATCTAAKTCTVCGQTEGEALTHSWREATCTTPKTCATCGGTEGGLAEHVWLPAGCTKPETCRHCGATRGSAWGHSWVDATCITPRRCTRCGDTQGSPLGHTFVSSDGLTKLCSVCGRTVDTKYVALTIDDGPSGSVTDTLLAGLAERGAKATFFVCGYRIRSYPWQPQKVLDMGHEIGLHTDTHATLTQLDADGIRRELLNMMALLPAGYTVRLMRPPGGAHNATVRQVCAEMGLTVTMWSVDPRDWATNNVDTIVNAVVNGARDGSIILMHELKNSSVQAALLAIDRLQAMGYEFVTVSELAAIKGCALTPGDVCYSF